MTYRRPSDTLERMNAIPLSRAAAKYNVPVTTLSNWYHAGLIRSVDHEGDRRVVLLFEPDVAALAAQYRPGRGRWKRPVLA